MNADSIRIWKRRIPKDAEGEVLGMLLAERSEAMKVFRTTAYVLSSLGTKLRISKNSKLSPKQASRVESGRGKSVREGLMFGG
jgi:hypothetical protein